MSLTPDDVARAFDVPLEQLLCAPDSGCPRCATLRAGASGQELPDPDLPTTDPDHAPGRPTNDPATGAGRTEER